MSQTAFLFPGQGSQSLGMMAALADISPQVHQTFAQASGVLGYDLWALCQQGPEEELNRTEITQPAMLAAGIATWRVWLEAGGTEPALMAGHSLGEYSALVAAGAMGFEDAIGTVAERGRLMQKATPAGMGAMAAILGLEDEPLQAICAEQAAGQVVSCANFNSPGQVVIAGHREAVERACEAARAAGARRAIVLPVSVPSHCALMKPAADALAETLATLSIQTPTHTVIHNADVAAHAVAADIRAALHRQLWQPVRWTDSIRHLVNQGVTRFVECGPGKVLTGLNRRIHRDAESIALIDSDSLAAALGETTT